VRKRVYVVQKFRSLQFRELSSSYSSAILPSSGAGSPNLVNSTSPVIINTNTSSSSSPVPIHMIVPVSGRLQTLKRLLTNFDHVVLRTNDSDLFNIHLYIILMETAEDSGERMSTIVDYIKKFLGNHLSSRIHLIEVPNGNFTRGYARSYGASRFNDTDLLFFIDLDMVFTRDLFSRIRHRTIYNKQVYFPIIFSQYDPHYWDKREILTNFSSFHLRDDIGYWRQYGFGMLGIYKADLRQTGNWNVIISGWGKEDVEIYDKLVQSSSLNVFRTIDNSLMHIFHTKECSTALRHDQMNMCKGTKSITLGSQRVLVRYVQKMIELNKI
jgi:chondroitin sulfate synthase